MDLHITFIGRAEPLAELYAGIGSPSFALSMGGHTGPALVVPNIGDLLLLRMHPGPDIRQFRCTNRVFDFSSTAEPLLRIEPDMP